MDAFEGFRLRDYWVEANHDKFTMSVGAGSFATVYCWAEQVRRRCYRAGHGNTGRVKETSLRAVTRKWPCTGFLDMACNSRVL